MNLTTLVNNSAKASAALSASSNTANGKPNAAAAAKGSAASPLNAVQKRVGADVDSVKTQLSAFGVLKSAVSQSQTAAQALGKLGATSTDADTTQAMARFLNGYNAVVGASQSASNSMVSARGGNGAANGASDSVSYGVSYGVSNSVSNSAARVGKDFQRAVASGTATDALQKLGLSTQRDGTLVQDAKTFAQNLKADPAGVRAALGKLGAAVDATAGKAVSPTGTLGDAMNRLNQRNTTLTAQQKALATAAQGLAAYKANSYGDRFT